MRRSELVWLFAGAVVGVVVLVTGLGLLLNAGGPALGLLLPFAVLAGGLLWAFGAVGSEPAAATTPAQSVGPSIVMPGGADAVDAPTIVARPKEPEGESVSEAVRLEAARSFDLGSFLLDEPPDRIQCSNCGRYADLVRSGERDVTCRVCGTTRTPSDVQPDTRVRMHLDGDDGPAALPASEPEPEPEPEPEADAPTIVPAGTTRFAPPTSHRGG